MASILIEYLKMCKPFMHLLPAFNGPALVSEHNPCYALPGKLLDTPALLSAHL